MLQFNFDRMLKARGIEMPFSYLKRNGFADKLATNIKNNNIRRMNLSTVEKLCIVLRCTPNDLVEWIPDESFENDQDHPLNQIKKSDLVVNITKTLNSVPLAKLEKIDKMIKESMLGD